MEKELKVGDKVKYIGNDREKKGIHFEVVQLKNSSVKCHGLEAFDSYSEETVKRYREEEYPNGAWDLMKRDLEYVSRMPIRKITHIITYDKKGCGDPHIFCYGLDDMKERTKKLLFDNNTVKESVIIFDVVQKRRKPTIQVRF